MNPTQTSVNRLDGAPAEYREPEKAPSLAEARRYCKQLAESHYENFHVATQLLPKAMRPHFHAVYSYCRIADDLGDEIGDTKTSLRLLDEWQAMLHEAYDRPESAKHPVFVALADTVRVCNIPREPFLDLLVAFRSDQQPHVYLSLADLEQYSRYSANPVGRLVLHIAGYHDEHLLAYSDKVCTGLQLANIWQDVGEDLRQRNRIYIPADAMERFGVDVLELRRGEASPQFRAMLAELAAHTFALLETGTLLEKAVDGRLAMTLGLFRKGGQAILNAIAQQNFDTISKRPIVGKSAKVKLLMGAATDFLRGKFSRRSAQ